MLEVHSAPVTEVTDVTDVGCSPRRERLEHVRHLVAITLSVAASVAALAGWTPGATAVLVIAIAAVVIGLPHGALDVVVGPSMVGRPVFFGSYLAFIAAAVAAWLVVPLLSFVMFLAVSSFHFARGDAAHHRELGSAGSLLGMSTAGVAIGLPLALHSETVAPLISDLLLGKAVLSTQQVSALGVAIAHPSIIAGIVAGVAAVQARRPAAVVELVVIALMAATVHPLVSFALYFALWHSPRHLIGQDLELSAVKPTLAATAATLFAAAFVWRFVEPSAEVAVQVVFIGLAALTGPHLVVTELLGARVGRVRRRTDASGTRRALRQP